jgi:hypothetical protein
VTQQHHIRESLPFRPFADVQTEFRRACLHLRLQVYRFACSASRRPASFRAFGRWPAVRVHVHPDQIEYSQHVNTDPNGVRYPVLTWTRLDRQMQGDSGRALRMHDYRRRR